MKKLVLLALLFTGVVFAFDAEYRSEEGRALGPRVVSLDKIRQVTEPAARALLNPDDEEEWNRNIPLAAPTTRITQHKDVKDGTMAAIRGPVLGINFSGLPSEGNAQPDAIVAAGPAHVMVAVNHSIAIYTKTGTRRFMTDFTSWFAPLNNVFAGAIVFDPQVVYDQYSKHYLFVCTARRRDKRSWYLFSISKTSNPFGEWAYYAIDMQVTGKTRYQLWADYPRLGVDQNAVYLTANMFTFGSLIYRFPKLLVLKKSDLYTFKSLKYSEFVRYEDATGVFARNVHPVHSYGPAPAGYLVNTRNDAGNKITLWEVSFNEPKPVLRRIPVNVSSYKVPPFALQKNGKNVMMTATEGTGALSAIYRKGYIYTVHPIAHIWNTETVSALRYYQIDTTGKVIDEITYGSDGSFYYMPAVAANLKGDVVIAFNRSGRNEYAGIFFCGRRSTDPLGTLSSATPLRRGESNYEVPFNGTNINHWGDYNGVSVDPSNGSFWVFGEYAKTVDTWNTWIGRVSFPQ